MLFLGVLMSGVAYAQTTSFLSHDFSSDEILSKEFWQTATAADVQKEIDDGANVNARSEALPIAHWTIHHLWTPLMYASWYSSNPSVIAVLIKNGADANARTAGGYTPLMFASNNNSEPAIIETLIMYGADVNTRSYMPDMTPLMFAGRFSSEPKVIEVLLKHGADVNAHTREGRTALYYAKSNYKIYKTDVYNKMSALMAK